MGWKDKLKKSMDIGLEKAKQKTDEIKNKITSGITNEIVNKMGDDLKENISGTPKSKQNFMNGLGKHCCICNQKMDVFLNRPYHCMTLENINITFDRLEREQKYGNDKYICAHCFSKEKEIDARNGLYGEKAKNDFQIIDATHKINEIMQDKKNYTFKYIGGHPLFSENISIHLCPIQEGVFCWRKISRNKLEELFIIPWSAINSIAYSSRTEGDSASRSGSLTTAAITGSEALLVGALLQKKTERIDSLIINVKDEGDFIREIIFEGKNTQEASAYLMAQRSILYKNHDSMVSHKANSTQISLDKKTDKIDEINKIKQLAELKQAGIITEEEFETKKKELLAKV